MTGMTKCTAATVAASAIRIAAQFHPDMPLLAAEQMLARLVCEAIGSMREDRLIHEQAAEAYLSAGVQELLPPWKPDA